MSIIIKQPINIWLAEHPGCLVTIPPAISRNSSGWYVSLPHTKYFVEMPYWESQDLASELIEQKHASGSIQTLDG